MSDPAHLLTAVRTELVGTATVTALIPASSMLLGWYDHNATLPQMTLWDAGFDTITTDQGTEQGIEGEVYLNFWGRDPDVLSDVATKARVALQGAALTATNFDVHVTDVSAIRRFFEKGTELHRVMLVVSLIAEPTD